MMSWDYTKRDYLLPDGCKDLIDVLNLKKPAPPHWGISVPLQKLPTIIGEIVVPEGTSVAKLAELLGQDAFKIVADIMELGVFALPKQVVDFDTMQKVARQYGYVLKRAG